MKAVVVRATGDAGVLRVEEAERPEPDEGEVLIRVKAAAINPVDWKYRRGLAERQLPAVLGEDVSGTVEVSRTAGFSPETTFSGSRRAAATRSTPPPPLRRSRSSHAS